MALQVDPVQSMHTLHVGDGVKVQLSHMHTCEHTTHDRAQTHTHTHTKHTHLKPHAPTCQVPSSHILMIRSSDPLMMRLLSNCSVVTAALCPLKVRFISYVDRSHTMMVQSPDPDTNMSSLNWTQTTWSVCPLHTARKGQVCHKYIHKIWPYGVYATTARTCNHTSWHTTE